MVNIFGQFRKLGDALIKPVLHESHRKVLIQNKNANNFWADSGLWDFTLARLLDTVVRNLISSCSTVFGLSTFIESASLKISKVVYTSANKNTNILFSSGFKLFSYFILCTIVFITCFIVIN